MQTRCLVLVVATDTERRPVHMRRPVVSVNEYGTDKLSTNIFSRVIRDTQYSDIYMHNDTIVFEISVVITLVNSS